MARPKPLPNQSQPPEVSRETTAPPEVSAGDFRLVAVEVPLAAEPVDPLPHHIDVQLRSTEARAGLARLRDGAIASGMTVGGRPVQSSADAVRALLEQFGRN